MGYYTWTLIVWEGRSNYNNYNKSRWIWGASKLSSALHVNHLYHTLLDEGHRHLRPGFPLALWAFGTTTRHDIFFCAIELHYITVLGYTGDS